MKTHGSSISKTHERLRTLYAVSKLLSNFEDIEKTFSEIISSAAESFPLLSAVLIEDWEKEPRTSIWHFDDATKQQKEAAIINARNSYAYFSGASLFETVNIYKEKARYKILQRNSKTLGSYFKEYGKFIVLPLVVFNLPTHGALQIEGAFPLDEEDLEFVGALAGLIAVALDRYYNAKNELDFTKNEVIKETAKLSFSKDEISSLENEKLLRESFVSLVTHDLKTPLTSVLMAANLIIKKRNDPEMCTLLATKIGISIKRIEQMINNLLDANLIRSGQHIPLNLEFFNLYNLIKTTVEELISIYGERFIVKGSETVKGCWDKKAIGRIIENLCNNAIKYGSNDTPVVISIEDVSVQKIVRINVHNEGNVISLNDQKTIFDQFRRSEDARQEKNQGWGLGLTLVRGVAEAHSGTVSVESDSINGTTFTVTLPTNLKN